MEQEEAGKLDLVDQLQLAVETCSCTISLLRGACRVPLGESVVADLDELLDGWIGPVREVGVAVPELFGEVELEPLCDDARPLRSGSVDAGEALDHLLGRPHDALPVAAPLLLAAVERGAAADRDENVLQERAPRMVRM